MRLAGEPREAERLTRGSEGGGWKSAGIHQIHGNSLAAYPTVDVFAWPNWLVYILLALVPVLVFFLNMRDTHRVLAAEKKRQLEAVRRNIVRASRALMERIAAGESTGTLAAEINALALYEERLQAARTWPYDTAMLRTLFFSLIIPAAAELVKLVSQRLF